MTWSGLVEGRAYIAAESVDGVSGLSPFKAPPYGEAERTGQLHTTCLWLEPNDNYLMYVGSGEAKCEK